MLIKPQNDSCWKRELKSSSSTSRGHFPLDQVTPCLTQPGLFMPFNPTKCNVHISNIQRLQFLREGPVSSIKPGALLSQLHPATVCSWDTNHTLWIHLLGYCLHFTATAWIPLALKGCVFHWQTGNEMCQRKIKATFTPWSKMDERTAANKKINIGMYD